MPKSCVAYGCTNHNMMYPEKISFHVFPKEITRREKWIQAVRRVNADGSKWKPSTHAVLCGKHFIGGTYLISLSENNFLIQFCLLCFVYYVGLFKYCNVA